MSVGQRADVLRSSPFVRFLAVGVLNTVVGYALFALLTWMGLPYPVAIGLATVMGVMFNYQSTGRMVFGRAPRRLLFRFVGAYCVIYLLNVACVGLLLHLGFSVYLSNALVLLPLAIASYFILRNFVFNTP